MKTAEAGTTGDLDRRIGLRFNGSSCRCVVKHGAEDIVFEDLVVRDGRFIADVTKRARADRTVFGHKKFARENPDIAAERFDRIVKNTYRTLMTRGMRGCYVYSVDAETREYFRSAAFRN